MKRDGQNSFAARSHEFGAKYAPFVLHPFTRWFWFPCFHGTAVLCEKYGSHNLYKHIAWRHLTKAWKENYYDLCSLPPAYSVDKVIKQAKRLVALRQHLKIPKAIPPPRGRPVKNAGKRKKGWYERGPAASKRKYSCSLCRSETHSVTDCALRQLYEDDNTK